MRSLIVAALLTAPVAAHAVPLVSLHSSNVGISAFSYSFDAGTNTITINETWTSAGLGSLLFSGLDAGVNYIVVKSITNNTGSAIDEIANELLDPAGQQNDLDRDPGVQPSFVPAGFTTSNDFDGLSFAQGSSLPRTSDVFDDVSADELTDARDFLDYFDGVLADGATGSLTFGLRDNLGSPGDNQPFLLIQRPNTRSIPAPAAVALFGLGLAAVALRRR